MKNYRLSILLVLLLGYSCGTNYSKPDDTCLAVWKAMSTLDMDTIKELSTEDSQFALSILEGILKNQGFYYFARSFGFLTESDAMSGLFENNFECEVVDGEGRCYFRQPGGMLNRGHHWKFRRENGKFKFVVGMYLLN